MGGHQEGGGHPDHLLPVIVTGAMYHGLIIGVDTNPGGPLPPTLVPTQHSSES